MWYIFHHSQREAISTLKRLGVGHGTVRFYGRCHIHVAKGGRMNIGNNFFVSIQFACQHRLPKRKQVTSGREWESCD